MPSKSKAQRNLMAAAAHNPAFAKKVGVPVSVAQEFNKADKGKKFGGGGMAKGCATKSDAKMIAKKEVKGHEKSMHGMKKGGITEAGTGEKYASKAAMMKHEKKESKAEEMKEHGMKKGGMCKGYKEGGVAKTVTKEMEYDYKTGKKSFAGSTAKRDAHAEKEGKIVAKHAAYDKAMGMKKGGSCKGYSKGGQLSKANGIAVRGKSKGRII